MTLRKTYKHFFLNSDRRRYVVRYQENSHPENSHLENIHPSNSSLENSHPEKSHVENSHLEYSRPGF